MTTAYVDASALTKLVIDEIDSDPMRRWYIETDRVLCSRVGIIEVNRAAARSWYDRAHLNAILESVEVVELNAEIARLASTVGPALLRTLDAIHLASSLTLVAGLDAFVTYDHRLADAARAVGLPVVIPA